MTERFKEVIGAPGYEIGDHGTLLSYRIPHNEGRRETPKVIKPYLEKKSSGSGRYLTAKIWANGKRTNVYIHQLVITHFVSPRPEGMFACHEDDCKTNNYYKNLKWKTRKENGEDAVRNGKLRSGGNHYASKIKDEDIPKIFEMRKNGETHAAIAEKFGVVSQTITHILTGRNRKKTWIDISKPQS